MESWAGSELAEVPRQERLASARVPLVDVEPGAFAFLNAAQALIEEREAFALAAPLVLSLATRYSFFLTLEAIASFRRRAGAATAPTSPSDLA